MLSIRTGMKVAIIGSRNYAKLHLVQKMVEVLPPGCILISGGARGVDTIAEEAARSRGLTVQVFPAEWRKYGRGAGIRRNRDIIAHADVVLAFWNGISPGTEHSIQLAKSLGKPVQVFQR
jgi:predicted Rossmann fold nucleotide-binding protein DprA/Smf involved in DNA uptake